MLVIYLQLRFLTIKTAVISHSIVHIVTDHKHQNSDKILSDPENNKFYKLISHQIRGQHKVFTLPQLWKTKKFTDRTWVRTLELKEMLRVKLRESLKFVKALYNSSSKIWKYALLTCDELTADCINKVDKGTKKSLSHITFLYSTKKLTKPKFLASTVLRHYW